MRKMAMLLALSFVLVSFAAAVGQDAAALIKKADELYAQRSGNNSITEQAIAAAEEAYKLQPSYDAAWRAARSCFWMCDRTENKERDKLYGKRGWDWGEKAIAANPNGVEGHYYYCISLGEYGKGAGIAKSISVGLNKKYEQECNRAISINANYDHAGPLRSMGVYYKEVPWPLYSAKKSEELLLKSAQLSPNVSRTYFYLLELYIKEKNWPKAREAFQKIMSTQPYADEGWEDGWYKQEAKKLEPQIQSK